MRLKLQILLTALMISRWVSAQTPEQISAYINTYKYLAIAEMQRTGVPAAIILAQGIHETCAGTSDLVIASNNHFGIKCKAGWTGQTVYHDDDAKGECFRSYPIASDSYKDHSDYLRGTPRYSFLFKLNPEDYEGWAYGLKKAGYATNIKYSQILIKLIEEYNLENYSLIAMGKLPAEQPSDGTLAGEMMRSSLPGFTDSSVRNTAPVMSYPDGEFSINAAKCIYAKAGISLLSLSNQFNIPLAHMLDFNDMKQEDVLSNDQLIFLQRKRKVGSTEFHIVQPGESIYSICQSEGIRYESILEFNRLNPGEEPAPGEKIYLQSLSGNKPALKNSASIKTTIPSS